MRSPGDILGSFRLIALLGRGGVAEVWRAEHTALGSAHAIKFLSVTTESLEERLLLEGRTQAGLAHPNVVRVTEVVRDAAGVGLVMELVEGPTLERWLNAHYEPEALEGLFLAICAGVRAAHARGIVHRDLKPANVLLCRVGGVWIPKVSDFGIARVLDANQGTRTGALMGTLRFAAPEQLRDSSRVDERADVWALGCILYEMLSRRALVPDVDVVTLYERLRQAGWLPIDEAAPGAPVGLRRAVVAALRYDPADRPESVNTLMHIARGTTDSESGESRDLLGLRLVARIGGTEGTEAWRAEEADGTSVFVKFAAADVAAPVRARLQREARLGTELHVRGLPSGAAWFEASFRGVAVVGLRRPWVPGPSVDEPAARRGLDQRGALAIVEELLGILGDLHAYGPPVVHRDLCPQHLVRAATGLALVGLGRAQDRLPDPALGGATFVGTFGWQAPEQYGGDASPKTDVYTAAILAIYLLSGRDPATLLDVSGTLAWRTLPGIDPRIAPVLARMLETDPARRPTALEAHQALAAARAPAPAAAPPAAPVAPTGAPPVLEAQRSKNPLEPDELRAAAPLVAASPASPPVTRRSALVAALGLGALFGVGGMWLAARGDSAAAGAEPRGDRPYGFWLLNPQVCEAPDLDTLCAEPLVEAPEPALNWSFDGNPAAWPDSAPVLSAGITQGEGFIGSGLRFEGDHAPATARLDPLKGYFPAFTVSLWFRLRDPCTNDYVTLFTNGNGPPAATGTLLGVMWQGMSFAELASGNVNETVYPTSPSRRCMNTWSHVVLTFDQGKTALYDDGRLSIETETAWSRVLHGSHPITLGGSPLTTRRQLSGDIDEVRVYASALGADEVWSLHRQDSCRAGAHPIGLPAGG
ncbi:hypothetical protein LBMAG42_05530 [Deltaproteobacteria bacterium]|nr:hypothetical protein LBMAG42_05530 [Deltaproteobacteria bacterium]